MSYSRLNLSNGQAFTASHVTHMEDGIVDCENQLSTLTGYFSDDGGGRHSARFPHC